MELGANLLSPWLVLQFIVDLLASSVDEPGKRDTTLDTFFLDLVQDFASDNGTLANRLFGPSYPLIHVFRGLRNVPLWTKAVHGGQMLFAMPNQSWMNVSFLQLQVLNFILFHQIENLLVTAILDGLQAVIVPIFTAAFFDVAVGHRAVGVIVEVGGCTVFADEDAEGDHAVCRLIFLAIDTVFVERRFRHLFL